LPRRRIGKRLTVPFPEPLHHALRRRAKLRHMSQAEYLRRVFKEHLKALHKNDSGLNQSAIVLERFHSDVKQFILACRGVAIATKLPSAERREDLEAAAWKAVQDAVEWIKTEEAAENARARARIAQVLANLMRVENTILDSRDEAFLGNMELALDELEASRVALEEESKTTQRTQKTADR
jgi:hypothetical protein